LLKLQAEVAARKRPRPELWPRVRAVLVIGAVSGLAFALGRRTAAPEPEWTTPFGLEPDLKKALVRAGPGKQDLQHAYIEKLERIHRNSARYGIPADLAAAIEDIALAEGIDPRLAFELVRVESRFNPRARSPVGAVGFTQLMPETARLLRPGIRDPEMYERETNLRLGFRFLRFLINKYDGDVRLALLAYNRGPSTVDALLARGVDPSNGYVQRVLGE
jgi:soluble lytic murein transglycosylase-like protein